MSKATSTIRHATLWAVTAFLVGALLIYEAIQHGAAIESVAFPIYTNVTLNYIIRDEESAEVLLTGNKSRNCSYLATNVMILKEGHWLQANSVVLDASDKVIPIEERRVSVGAPFVRRMKIEPSGSSIKLRLEATCHSLWTSYQTLPVITVQVGQDNSIPQ